MREDLVRWAKWGAIAGWFIGLAIVAVFYGLGLWA